MHELYVKHFFNNVIELNDALGTSNVQNHFCDPSALFGVGLRTFSDNRQAMDWFRDCVLSNPCGIYNLRSSLV